MWSLWAGGDPNADTAIAVGADSLWRIWTKGIAPTEGRSRLEIAGDPVQADPFVGTTP
jgi:hypothetical protein